jgi:hypothetical protein
MINEVKEMSFGGLDKYPRFVVEKLNESRYIVEIWNDGNLSKYGDDVTLIDAIKDAEKDEWE